MAQTSVVPESSSIRQLSTHMCFGSDERGTAPEIASRQSIQTEHGTYNGSSTPNSAFIRSCQSPRELGSIIRVLAGRHDSAELLHVARDRLRRLQTVRLQIVPPAPPRRELLQKDCPSPPVSEAEARPSPNRFFVESEMNLSRISMNNSALESVDESKGSLNLSLSPSSALHGMKFVEMPCSNSQGQVVNELLPPVDSIRMGRLGTIDENFGSYDTSNTEATKINKKIPFLSTAVECGNMRAQLQDDNRNDVARVDKVVTQAERTVLDLKVKMSALSRKNRVLTRLVETTERNHKDSSDWTSKQVSKSPKVETKPDKTEKLWTEKVDHLNKRLQEVSEQARLVISAERQLRQQVELEGKLKSKRNEDLATILRQTTKQLNEVQTSYDMFERKLLRATGLDKEKVREVSKMTLLFSLSHCGR